MQLQSTFYCITSRREAVFPRLSSNFSLLPHAVFHSNEPWGKSLANGLSKEPKINHHRARSLSRATVVTCARLNYEFLSWASLPRFFGDRIRIALTHWPTLPASCPLEKQLNLSIVVCQLPFAKRLCFLRRPRRGQLWIRYGLRNLIVIYWP